MSSSATGTASEIEFEKHFTVKELSAIWRVSPQIIREWFCDEPGVLIVQQAKDTRWKKARRKLFIPESVAFRVHRLRRSN